MGAASWAYAWTCGRRRQGGHEIRQSCPRTWYEFPFAPVFLVSDRSPNHHDTISIPWLNLTKAPWLTRPNSVEQDLERFYNALRQRVIS
jgi:hypothetical protein